MVREKRAGMLFSKEIEWNHLSYNIEIKKHIEKYKFKHFWGFKRNKQSNKEMFG
jgi:hypothetical protein